MLLAAPAWRADGSDTISTATATVATLWGAMAGDPGRDSQPACSTAGFTLLARRAL